MRKVHVLSLVLVLLLASCRGKGERDPRLHALAADLAKSVVESDEELFLRSHVREGDKSPSGNYWLATRAGGVRPDAAWESEIRQAFRRLSDDVDRAGIDRRSLQYNGTYSADVYRVNDDPDRTNLTKLTLHFTAAGKSWNLVFAEGMLAKRGWVVGGEPTVVVREGPLR